MTFSSEQELDQKLLQNNESNNDFCDNDKHPKFLSLRFFISFISLMGCAVMYMTRNNLNVAIVDMVTIVKSEGPVKNVSLIVGDQCPIYKINESDFWKQGEFNWSPSTQGIVLGSFYYGEIFEFEHML